MSVGDPPGLLPCRGREGRDMGAEAEGPPSASQWGDSQTLWGGDPRTVSDGPQFHGPSCHDKDPHMGPRPVVALSLERMTR